MPFGIRKKGTKYQVVKKTSGKVFGTHTSRRSAIAQERAIGISMKRRGRK